MPIIGTIARLLTEKGFGFVRAGNEKEYFFHRTALIGAKFEELHSGQVVSFDPVDDAEKGPRAERVRIA
jgi:CspA family cold shock protein